MRALLFLTSLSTVIFVLTPAFSGTTWYVDGSVSASGDGSSWEAAFKAIQEGIDAASGGDVVIVAEGIYTQNVRFKGKNITLTSTNPLNAAVVARTVITVKGGGAVVTFSGLEDERCVLSGFTLRNGKSFFEGSGICGGSSYTHSRATIRHNTITRNSAVAGGGIAFCSGVIHDNTICDNSADYGGGGLYDCHGTIQDNTIIRNSAENGGGLFDCATIQGNSISENTATNDGGGLYHCDGMVRNNTISGNTAAQDGGALCFCGGTIQDNTIIRNSADQDGGGLFHCDHKINNNTISGNSSKNFGGGLSDCWGSIQNNAISGNSALYGGGLSRCHCPILDNVIFGNSASAGGGLLLCDGPVKGNFVYGNDGGDVGGGLYGCNGTVQNNIISGNTAIWGAGVALCDGVIQNNTIVANSAIWYGGGLGECEGTIENCIIWGNKPGGSGGQIHQSSTPSYCCIEDWTAGGERNISKDPQFVNPDGQDDDPETYGDNDYSLSPTSPCIDAGNNEAAELPETDILGNPRIVCGGRKKTPVVDIGAIEYYVNEIQADPDGGVTVTWSSLTGKTYAVHFSEDMMTWELADGNIVSTSNGTTSWVDDGLKTGILPSLVRCRFYRILLNE